MKHHPLISLVVTSMLSMAGAALVWGAWLLGNFQRADRLLLDTAQNQIPPQVVIDSPLVYVKIGDISDQPWPWQSLDYAILIHSILRYSPRAVLLDLPFFRTEGSPTIYDLQLKHQLARLNWSLISVPVLSTGRHLGSSLPLRPFATIPESPEIPVYGYGLWPIKQAADASTLAPQAFPTDPDGRVRRIPLIINYQGKPVASQILCTYARYRGADLSSSGAVMGSSILLRDKQGTLIETIPINRNGEITLRYYRNPPLRKEVEFYSVILASEQQFQQSTPPFDLGVFRNSLVLLGKEHPFIMESIQTPQGPLSPARLQLQALTNLLQQSYIKSISPPLMFVLLYLTWINAILISLLSSRIFCILGVATLLAGLSGIIALIFYFQGYWLDPTPLLCSTVAGSMAGRFFGPYLRCLLHNLSS